jgi:hypothetical protein
MIRCQGAGATGRAGPALRTGGEAWPARVCGQKRKNCARLGLYPIVTFQYSSTTLYQFSYHIQ